MAKVRFVAETGVMKQCFRCKIIKDTSEFHRSGTFETSSTTETRAQLCVGTLDEMEAQTVRAYQFQTKSVHVPYPCAVGCLPSPARGTFQSFEL